MLTIAGGIFLFFAICIGAVVGFAAIACLFTAICALMGWLFGTKEGFGTFIVVCILMLLISANQV